MRVIDMKREESGLDLYGVEHLWQIVNGSWKGLFEDTFRNKVRTEACLGEITEVRHNLAHRHKHHVVLRSSLIRFVQNCRMLLVALDTQNADDFTAIEESLNTGGSPWGNPLQGSLPPSGEIYDEFVGRPEQLEELSEWLNSDKPAVLIWGYGGAGKSALAYKFAREIRDGSYGNLQAVCWVSAKKSEFIDGDTRARPQDFHDLESFIAAVWGGLYEHIPDSLEPDELIKELNDTPTLLIIDDFDTVLYEDAELTEFLQRIRYSLSYPTTTRIIYTSRESNPLLNPQIEAPPFSDDELAEFVSLRARTYNIEESAYANRIAAIRSVTQAYPLFVDDWLRHASIVGVETAIGEWQHRRGDAAREYALRRQLERLPISGSVDVLMSLSIANKSLVIPEISQVAGLTDDDTEKGVSDLLNLRLAYKDPESEPSEPAYSMNNNTRRLVQQTYKEDAGLSGCQAAFKSLTGERVPAAKRRAIGRIIKGNMEIEGRQGFEEALRHLKENMTEELADSPDLYGQLGRLYGNQVKLYAERDQHDDNQAQYYCNCAREAFERASRLGTKNYAVYEQWIVWRYKSLNL